MGKEKIGTREMVNGEWSMVNVVTVKDIQEKAIMNHKSKTK